MGVIQGEKKSIKFKAGIVTVCLSPSPHSLEDGVHSETLLLGEVYPFHPQLHSTENH